MELAEVGLCFSGAPLRLTGLLCRDSRKTEPTCFHVTRNVEAHDRDRREPKSTFCRERLLCRARGLPPAG